MNEAEIAKGVGEGFATGLFAGISGTVIVIGFFAWLWVKYPSNVKLIFAQVWSVLTYLFGAFAERHYIVNHLEGKVGKSIENLNRKVDGLDAEQIKITLVREASREAFIRDRVLIMRLQKNDNHGENMANVAFLYSQHLYSKLEPSLNRTQQETIKLFTAKCLLKGADNEGLQVLSDKYYRPLVAKNTFVQPLINQLEVIDNKGLFFSVYIQEMIYLGNKTMFRARAKGVHEEVTAFTEFLVNFANRARGDDTVKLDFLSLNIKVSFLLVALPEKREAEDTESYVRRIERLPKAIESFYLTGWGNNISFVRTVAYAVVKKLGHLEVAKEKEYWRVFEDGRAVDAVFVLLRNRNIANFAEPQAAPVSAAQQKFTPPRRSTPSSL